MGIRQTINENPTISAVVTGAIIVAAIVFIIFSSVHRGPKFTGPGKAFYSDDDGHTWFTDDANKIPPFTDANGKQAVSVMVYKCGETGQPFVGYMLQYTPAGVKRMQEQGNQPGGHVMDVPPMVFPDVEVKKPGDPNWVTRTQDPNAFTQITTPTCPNGGDNIYPVVPQ